MPFLRQCIINHHLLPSIFASYRLSFNCQFHFEFENYRLSTTTHSSTNSLTKFTSKSEHLHGANQIFTSCQPARKENTKKHHPIQKISTPLKFLPIVGLRAPENQKFVRRLINSHRSSLSTVEIRSVTKYIVEKLLVDRPSN